VVVPDDVTFDNVPQITGLLTYQKDAEILRLRTTESWKVVAEEEMVKLSVQYLFPKLISLHLISSNLQVYMFHTSTGLSLNLN
jgi:hypothetical protein